MNLKRTLFFLIFINLNYYCYCNLILKNPLKLFKSSLINKQMRTNNNNNNNFKIFQKDRNNINKSLSLSNNKDNNQYNKEKSFISKYIQLFPVYPKEITKFLSLSLMMFWAIFVFTLSRDTKDTLIVTSCGAEAIAFLKVYGVVPAATLFMLLYSKLSTILSSKVTYLYLLFTYIFFFLILTILLISHYFIQLYHHFLYSFRSFHFLYIQIVIYFILFNQYQLQLVDYHIQLIL